MAPGFCFLNGHCFFGMVRHKCSVRMEPGYPCSSQTAQAESSYFPRRRRRSGQEGMIGWSLVIKDPSGTEHVYENCLVDTGMHDRVKVTLTRLGQQR